MASREFITIVLVMACVSTMMVALWALPGFSFNRIPTGHPGLAGPITNGAMNRGITGIQHGNTGNLGNSPTQTTGIPGIKVNPHFPNIVCYSRCVDACPGFRTPRDQQQCYQRCAAQCKG